MSASPELVMLQQPQAVEKRTVITTPDGKRTIITSGPNGKSVVVENDPNAPLPAVPEVPPAPTIAGSRGMPFQPMIPPQAVEIANAFFFMCAAIIIGWPLARAFGKRIERRGEVATIDSGTAEQLQRIEHAVDAMSIEIERISESQRFLAKLQSGAPAERVAR